MEIVDIAEKLFVGGTQCQKLIAIKVLENYRKQVREECAKVCEDYSEACNTVMTIRLSQDSQGILDYPEEMLRLDQGSVDGASYCAEAIRENTK